MNSQLEATVLDGGVARRWPLTIGNWRFQLSVRQNLASERRRNTAATWKKVVRGQELGGLGGAEPWDELDRHCRRTARLAMLLGRDLGFHRDSLTKLEQAARLHDIGKLLIASHTLTAGRLNASEWAEIRKHPTHGHKLLLLNSYCPETATIVLCHHERYDGKGYPNGLAGDDIPKEARALAVADSFDAMISERTYRPALSVAGARTEIARVAGTQFDPSMVQSFLRIPKRLLTLAEGKSDANLV